MASQDNKIKRLEYAVKNNDLDPLKEMISDLQNQVKEQEDRISSLQNPDVAELPEFHKTG